VENNHLEDYRDASILLQEVLGRNNCLLSFLTMDLTENDASNSSSIVEYIFIAMGICLLRCCLATIGDIHTYIQRKWVVNRRTVTGGQNYLVFLLCPSSGILKTRKQL
jgi:hypothetical protein